MELLGIGGSVHGNCSAAGIRIQQLHAPSETFKMALLICLIFSARAARGKNKNMIRPLARIFLRGFLYHCAAAWTDQSRQQR
jgi:hypothetical protein